MITTAQFESFSGETVWLNLSDHHQIIRAPSREELTDLIEEFRRRQLAWLQAYMLEPIEGRGQIFGLGASKVKARVRNPADGQQSWIATPSRIGWDMVPEEAWEQLSGAPPLPNSSHSTRIFNATIEQQQSFLRVAMGNSLESIERLLRNEYKDSLVYSWLSSAFEANQDPTHFLNALIKQAAFERQRERNGKRSFLCNAVPDLFLFWLAQHGIVLFPVARRPIIGESRGLEEQLLSPELADTWRIVESAYADSVKKNHRKWLRPIKSVFQILTTSSTLRTPEDLSLELFEALYARMEKVLDTQLTDRLHWIYRPLRDSLGRRELPTFKPIRYAAPALDNPFAWTRLSTKDHPQSTFPRMLSERYDPLPHVCTWSDRFARLMVKLPIKSIGNSVSTCQRFLVWLIESGIQISSLEELSREHINDGKPLSNSMCFRAHLSRANMKAETANANLLRLAWTFEAIIEEDNLQISNPVSIRFDTFNVPVARGKTPRRPMGRELLSYLRELNRRDNYALSRSYGAHQRQILNSNKQYEKAWFPGFAVIVDLLLQLPLRGYQARYLDSGEGDEEIIDIKSEHLQFRKNPLTTATPGRRESLFYTFASKDGAAMLGIHVNTNKTSLDRVSGYEISWCSNDLRDSLSMMREWQIEHNPVARPVYCIEKHEFEKTQNPEVIASLKTTYALFRDPADPRGWPLNRDKLFDYWSRLLATAEDELATKGINIRLTEEKEVSKGPKKKPIMKRFAAYDIHTLRVSGISALIEAGMPPDMVQEVAGHATLVMTLYYNKIKASRLNETLSKTLDKLHNSLDSIDGMSEAEFEHLSEFLVNNRAPEDAIGQSLLGQRIGHGDGAVEVSVHGICPGGECSTGGEFQNQAVGYGPVPRPLACSLCRYRLTGPMFLPGLVLNANRLMYELRIKGKEIAELNEERERLEDAGKPTHTIKAKIEALYRETDVVGAEWAAEVQYVHAAEKMFDRFIEDGGEVSTELPALVTAMDGATLESRLTRQSELGLLQSLAEGAALWPGFKPTAAIREHREFLNELLTASDLDPFLLKLRGDLREKAAVLLGRMVTSLVPDEHIDRLHKGAERLDNYPAVASLFHELRTQALTLGTLDEAKFLFENQKLLEEKNT
ncbi:VPA1269 family protein [Chromobacterium amazonense]|uniref:VPA1269 family protein n=1 Tax=Chromobacterium amazonense TaxID=1382803 RepID=A0ABU8V4J1_9NEIS|nr:VPA1269 family protein [Chromobacterium amazonense]MDQ4540326.1 VPA1269 family protein [Chromobacterium amazonense]